MAELTHGMDLAAVEEMGRALQARADDIDRIVGDIDALVASVEWIGQDGETFRHEWWPQHRSRVQAVAESVRGLGTSALNNASEQSDASGIASTPTRAGYAADGVTPISFLDFGDSTSGSLVSMTLSLALGPIGAAETLRQLIADIRAGRATAQQTEDALLNLIPGRIGTALNLTRDTLRAFVPDDVAIPILRIAGLDPPIAETIEMWDDVRNGRWDEVDVHRIVRPPLGPRLDDFLDLARALNR